MPVTGMSPVTAAMFIAAWVTIIAVIPPTKRRPKMSRVPSAIRTPAYAKRTKPRTIANVPSSPTSSPMMANTKSVCAAGR